MINLVKSMLRDESGAVTVDWVALTAGILLLGIAVLTTALNLVRPVYSRPDQPAFSRAGRGVSSG